ncbi:MAG: ribonuclease HI family protein [Patescibacteria group bacterium]|nr:ribonuclease HI family protein [Patescibacteria group bacterium]
MHLLFTDGGSRGNPGPAGAGFVICTREGQVVEKGNQFLWNMTNNEAEYQGLIIGLSKAVNMGITELNVYMDSQLIVKQIKGEYKIKKPELQTLASQVFALLGNIETYQFFDIRREKNTLADEQANIAMDRGK